MKPIIQNKNLADLPHLDTNFPIGSDSEERYYTLKSLYPDARIQFIKTLKDWYGLGLKCAKDITDEIWDTGCVDADIKIIATGNAPVDHDHLRKGIDCCFETWKTLGYNSPKEAIIDFLNRN